MKAPGGHRLSVTPFSTSDSSSRSFSLGGGGGRATAPLQLGESQAPSTSKLNSPVLPLNWLLRSPCFMAGRDPVADNPLFLPHLSHSVLCQSPTLLPPTSLGPCFPSFPLPPPLLDSCGSFLVSLLATSPAGYLFQPTFQSLPRALRKKRHSLPLRQVPRWCCCLC